MTQKRLARTFVGLLLFSMVASGDQGAVQMDSIPPPSHPSQGEVPLPASAGWNAYLVHDNEGVGVWTVKALDVLPQYGGQEIVALDDNGVCWFLVSYSGKWNAWPSVHDGTWLGALTLADVDPTRPGEEVYVGSQRGNLYQVVPHRQGGFDVNLAAYTPGEEIHTVISLGAPQGSSSELTSKLYGFTSPGAMHEWTISATPRPGRPLAQERVLGTTNGRIRDAVELRDGRSFATVARSGELAIHRLVDGRLESHVLYRDANGLGRLALRGSDPGGDQVLYATTDDGRLLRFAKSGGPDWQTETIYTGPQGPRGVAAGRFVADPDQETVAIFGYDKKARLLRRQSQGWEIETIFEDLDKGHWLAAAELDPRNGTDELILSGYAGRVVLLSRPPGFGMATDGTVVSD